MNKFRVSRRFFGLTTALALLAMGLIWYEPILLAVEEAKKGRWWPIVGIIALFVAVVGVLGFLFGETVPTRRRIGKPSPSSPSLRRISKQHQDR